MAKAPQPAKEPLHNPHAVALHRPMRMDARRATPVVADPTMPRSPAKQAPHWAAARGDGAFRAVCFVATSRRGSTIRVGSLRASHPEKLPVATAWELCRGSLTHPTSTTPRKWGCGGSPPLNSEAHLMRRL